MGNHTGLGNTEPAGTYRCTNCGHEVTLQAQQHLPACPVCEREAWAPISGAGSTDAAESDIEPYGAAATSDAA